jgi:DNA-binding MarR family transcriptional regulator
VSIDSTASPNVAAIGLEPPSVAANPPKLFGSVTRTRFLAYFGVGDCASLSRLAAELRIDKSHVIGLVKHFEGMGVLCVDRNLGLRHAVKLNREFVAYRELRALLRSLAHGRRSAETRQAGRRNVAERSDPPKTLDRLLGTRDRTTVVALLGRFESLTITEIAALSGISHNSARVVVAHLAHEHAVRCIRIPPSVHVSLDRRTNFGIEIFALAQRLGSVLPSVKDIPMERARHRLNISEHEGAARRPESLLPIGTETQAKIIFYLSLVGSIRTADLAKLAQLTQDQIRGVAESLVSAGIAIHTSKTGGRNLERWYSINMAHPLSPSICEYTDRIRTDSTAVLKRLSSISARTEQRLTRSRSEYKMIGGTSRRTDVLLSVWRKPGQLAAEVARSIDSPVYRTEAHLVKLSRLGLLTYSVCGGELRAFLNSRFRYERELGSLLNDLASSFYSNSQNLHGAAPGGAAPCIGIIPSR